MIILSLLKLLFRIMVGRKPLKILIDGFLKYYYFKISERADKQIRVRWNAIRICKIANIMCNKYTHAFAPTLLKGLQDGCWSNITLQHNA